MHSMSILKFRPDTIYPPMNVKQLSFKVLGRVAWVRERTGGCESIMNGRGAARTLSRRQLLRIGGVGSLGLTLPRLLRAEAERRRREARRRERTTRPIRSCILIFYYGGPSHIDTFDMKPNAPAEIRGQFGSIATSVPGLRVCEHLPHTARVMDRLAIVRSMHHPMTNHNAAAFTALCGRNPLKGDLELLGNDRNDPPCYGAILSATLARAARPAHVRCRCRT